MQLKKLLSQFTTRVVLSKMIALFPLKIFVFLIIPMNLNIVLAADTKITECIHKDDLLKFRCADEIKDKDLTLEIRSLNESALKCYENQVNITELHRLDIELCDWSTIPEEILKNFQNLTHLNLRMLSLDIIRSHDLPAMAKRDIMDFHQISVDISNNKLIRIENDAFQHMRGVTFLDISHNRLQHMAPSTFTGLTSLEVLDLGYNQVIDLASGLFRELTKLKKLVLVRNRIRGLGNDLFSKENSLIIWNLSRNFIVDLTRGSFANLHHLEYLDISYCEVSYIEGKAFTPLRRLKYLDLSHNRLTHIDFDVFACNSDRLQTLLLADNQLTTFSGQVDNFFPNLLIFRIENNLFDCTYLRNFFANVPGNVRRASEMRNEATNENGTSVYGVHCVNANADR